MRPLLLTVTSISLIAMDGDSLRADGLIFRLPPDGTRVTYAYRQEVRFNDVSGLNDNDEVQSVKKLEQDGTLTIASVGVEQVEGQRCRWIEIVWRISNTDDPEDDRREASKFLIPEEHLKAGADPLKHVITIYHTSFPGNWTLRLVEDAAKRRIELERYRHLFPPPVSAANRINESPPDERVQTLMGTMVCRRHIFDTSLNLGLCGPARLHRYGVHRLWLSEMAPFGLVALEYLSENQEVSIPLHRDRLAKGEIQFVTRSGSSFERLELEAVERNVTSVLSDPQ